MSKNVQVYVFLIKILKKIQQSYINYAKVTYFCAGNNEDNDEQGWGCDIYKIIYKSKW